MNMINNNCCKKEIFAAQKSKEMKEKEEENRDQRFDIKPIKTPTRKRRMSNSIPPNYEELVFMYSKDLCKLRYGNDDEDVWELLVKIQTIDDNHKKHTIYRKAIGYSMVHKGTIMLGYRSRSILGEYPATVEPACWFCYCWKHFNSVVRWPFRIAVIALGFALISTIKDLIDIIRLF